MRRLIINADDFGLTSGVNRAIAEAHSHGVVTSTTLMANAPGFSEAVRVARSTPRLSVGCHVVLVDGTPLLPPSQVSSLLTRRAEAEPRFRDGFASFMLQAFGRRLRPEQVEAEVGAQIHRIQWAGLTVTHFDTHKHTHMFSQVLAPMLAAARARGLRALRNPFEVIQLTQLAARPIVWKRWFEVGILRGLGRSFRSTVRQAGMRTPDGTLGIVATGALDARLFRSIVANLPEGTWELVCHPGYNDADLRQAGTRLKESRAEELRLLTSPEAREVLTRGGIELISYADLG